jgi:hypothetical protein
MFADEVVNITNWRNQYIMEKHTEDIKEGGEPTVGIKEGGHNSLIVWEEFLVHISLGFQRHGAGRLIEIKGQLTLGCSFTIVYVAWDFLPVFHTSSKSAPFITSTKITSEMACNLPFPAGVNVSNWVACLPSVLTSTCVCTVSNWAVCLPSVRSCTCVWTVSLNRSYFLAYDLLLFSWINLYIQILFFFHGQAALSTPTTHVENNLLRLAMWHVIKILFLSVVLAATFGTYRHFFFLSFKLCISFLISLFLHSKIYIARHPSYFEDK